MLKQHKQTRQEQLMPDGKPRYVQCYNNGGKTADQYTVVLTGRYRHKTWGEFWNICMSLHPFHPQGIGMHGTSKQRIDQPSYRHLGKRIKFDDLPEDCRKLILKDYKYLWDLN